MQQELTRQDSACLLWSLDVRPAALMRYRRREQSVVLLSATQRRPCVPGLSCSVISDAACLDERECARRRTLWSILHRSCQRLV